MEVVRIKVSSFLRHKPNNDYKWCIFQEKHGLSDIYELLTILAKLPLSIATVERSFQRYQT